MMNFKVIVFLMTMLSMLGLSQSVSAAASSGTDRIWAITKDSSGNIFVAGDTTGALGEANAGSVDIFIAKYSSSGVKQWVKQLGWPTMGAAAGSWNYAKAITLDASGNIYIAGETGGSLGGESNAGVNDIIIAKFDSSGVKQWIKQLGATTMGSAASGADSAVGIALDGSGNIYISGYTTGSLGETNAGSQDAFVAKFNSSGVKQWITQLGTTNGGAGANAADFVSGIALDSSGNSYITGMTGGALAESNAGYDVFIAKFNSSGVKQWVKQLGAVTWGPGTSYDKPEDIILDGSGNIFISGVTQGDFAETGGGNDDLFIAKFNSSGTVQWVKQLGNTTMGAAASGYDYGQSLALDSSGNIYVAGNTSGSLGETGTSTYDIIVAKFNSSGTNQWVKQLGSVSMGPAANANDFAETITLDSSNNIYIGGYTYGSLVETNGGSTDGYLMKFNSSGTLQWARQLGAITCGGTTCNPPVSNNYVCGVAMPGKQCGNGRTSTILSAADMTAALSACQSYATGLSKDFCYVVPSAPVAADTTACTSSGRRWTTHNSCCVNYECSIGKYGSGAIGPCTNCTNKPTNAVSVTYSNSGCSFNRCDYATVNCGVGKLWNSNLTYGGATCTTCTGLPANAHYTTNNSCAWSCNSGYTWNGSACI